VRPKSTSIEIDRDAVRCLIEEGAPDPTIADGDDGAHGPSPTPDSSAFQRDSSAAVTRATGRRVVAFIPKRDAKAGTAKQTFILDRPRERF
jgi:hypothetical protein